MSDKRTPDTTRELLGKLWSRTQQQANRAARYGRDMLALRQLRADREKMFGKLGKEVRQLVEGGEIDHPGVTRGVGRITEIEGKIRAQEDAMRAKGVEPESEEASAAANAVSEAVSADAPE
jgi:hypothetical protein